MAQKMGFIACGIVETCYTCAPIECIENAFNNTKHEFGVFHSNLCKLILFPLRTALWQQKQRRFSQLVICTRVPTFLISVRLLLLFFYWPFFFLLAHYIAIWLRSSLCGLCMCTSALLPNPTVEVLN